MKRVLFLCALVAAALTVQSAKADDFTISFTGAVTGSGVFVGTETSPGVYDITGVLSGSVTDPVLGASNIVSTSDYFGSDNTLFFPDPGTGFLDINGLSFVLANGVDLNLFQSVDAVDGTTVLSGGVENDALIEIDTLTVSPFTPPVPEPSSIVFLGTAALLGAADFLRRRRLQA
jgi:PEP-CTERM motif